MENLKDGNVYLFKIKDRQEYFEITMDGAMGAILKTGKNGGDLHSVRLFPLELQKFVKDFKDKVDLIDSWSLDD